MMRWPHLLAVCATLLAAGPLAGGAFAEGPRHESVLLVTGVDYQGHRWQETAPAVRRILEADGRLRVKIVETPNVLATDEALRHRVIVMHFKNYERLENQQQAQENLLRHVREGGGLVLLHFACGAFEDWDGFQEIAGRVWDRKLTHDPRGPFTVNVIDCEHPVTRGMEDFDTDDELYFCLTGDRPIRVLATARSKVTGNDHPMAFVFEFGKGRVFHTPLGHDVKAFEMPGVAQLIRRGTLWAAGLDPAPQP